MTVDDRGLARAGARARCDDRANPRDRGREREAPSPGPGSAAAIGDAGAVDRRDASVVLMLFESAAPGPPSAEHRLATAPGAGRGVRWRREAAASADAGPRSGLNVAYVVIARWTAQEGREAEVKRALEQLIEPSRAEPGNRFYQPSQDPLEPRVFVLYELYDDEAAYRAHGDSEHFQTAGRADGDPAARESRAGVLRDGRRTGLSRSTPARKNSSSGVSPPPALVRLAMTRKLQPGGLT